MNEEPRHPWIEPELEARIVALVLGEASDFERDELGRLIEERSELAALKKQIENVHGLLRDVATGEPVAEEDDWKLSAEKRSAVLAVISGEVDGQPTKQVLNNSSEKRRSVQENFFWNLTKIAAVLCVVGITGRLAISFFIGSNDSALMNQTASRKAATSAPFSGEKLLAGVQSTVAAGTWAEEVNEEPAAAAVEPAEVAEFDYEKNSKTALSAIRRACPASIYNSLLKDSFDHPPGRRP